MMETAVVNGAEAVQPVTRTDRRPVSYEMDTEGFGQGDLNPETHQLNDFKDLCKSVASLLHIECALSLGYVGEDQAAAAMLKEPLSGRRDLVEGLDAEAIFDYLTQHGVLDTCVVQELRATSNVTQRNAALLQHVEGEGHNAVALFINALRQSGQLHLASSLDDTPRIKPLSQSGKQRHKGEVTIMIKVHTLLLVVPERDSEGDVIDASMLASPLKSNDRSRLHQSYQDMLMLDDDLNHRGRRLTEYSYGMDEEEDYPLKKSFFCFCFPSRRKKAKERKYLEQQQHNGEGQQDRTTQDSNSRGNQGNMDQMDASLSADGDKKGWGSGRKDTSVVEQPRSGKVLNGGGGRGKENQDPIIMEYNKQMELVRLRAQRQRHKANNSVKVQPPSSSAIVMCQKWKSAGQYFCKKVTALCQQFEFDLQTYVIKYVEQERGTLVLSIWTDGRAMFVSTICMTRDQLRQLEADYSSGTLKSQLDALLRTNQCLHKLDILDMDLKIFIEEDQLKQAWEELV